MPPSGAHGMPRVSEQTALSMNDRGVRATVVRMPQVHDRAKQGFAIYLLAHAREQGVLAYSAKDRINGRLSTISMPHASTGMFSNGNRQDNATMPSRSRACRCATSLRQSGGN